MNSPLVDLWESLPPSDAELEEMEDGVELSVELAPDLSDDEASAVDGDEAAGGEPTRAYVEQTLLDAANGAAVAGVGLDEFMKAAWRSFLTANPDVHEEIERNVLIKHLKMLRRTGKMGQA